MLVMAGACVDSAIKQLFKDAVPHLIREDDDVRKGLERFAERALKQKEVEGDLDTKLLSKVLTSAHPLEFLSEAYVYELTGSSLQSADQLMSACAALGLDGLKEVKLDPKRLRRIFGARNDIVHEMDIDFDAARRNRNQRKIGDMVEDANALLEVADAIVRKIHEKLSDPMKTPQRETECLH